MIVKFIVYCSKKHNVSFLQTKGGPFSSVLSNSDGQDILSILYNPVQWICLAIKMFTLLCISASSHFIVQLPHTLYMQ